jgi:hypothetical protein
MVDYSAIRAHFDSQKYHYYTFHTKSEKPIKAVIRQLPTNTPAEDISSSLQDLGFSIINVKQMTSSRPSAEQAQTRPTSLSFLSHWTGQKSPRKFSDLQTSATSQ